MDPSSEISAMTVQKSFAAKRHGCSSEGEVSDIEDLPKYEKISHFEQPKHIGTIVESAGAIVDSIQR